MIFLLACFKMLILQSVKGEFVAVRVGQTESKISDPLTPDPDFQVPPELKTSPPFLV